jgi:hypothetical protein
MTARLAADRLKLIGVKVTEGPAGVLNSTSRSPKKRNAVDMPGSAAAVEAS